MAFVELCGEWRDVTLTDCRVFGGKIRNCHFDRCGFEDVETRYLDTDSAVRFTHCDVRGFEVDRITIEGIQNYGGLTQRQLSDMAIRDDLAELRKRFTGFQLWLHMLSLVIFFAPFALFVGYELAESAAIDLGAAMVDKYTLPESVETEPETSDPDSPLETPVRQFAEEFDSRVMRFGDELKATPRSPLLVQLWRFALRGGRPAADGGVAYTHVVLMASLILYNVLRMVLLRQTLVLDHQQRVSGVHSPFEFADHPMLRVVYRVSESLWLPYLFASGANAALFAMKATPT